jgi:hypothetical protein
MDDLRTRYSFNDRGRIVGQDYLIKNTKVLTFKKEDLKRLRKKQLIYLLIGVVFWLLLVWATNTL